MSDELVTVKISTAEQLLGAGYVPEGRNLRGKKGDLVDASFLSGYAGKVVSGRPTESEDYPVTVDGQILPDAAVHFAAHSVELRGNKQYGIQFEDASVTLNGVHYTAKEANALSSLFAGNRKTSKK